LLTFACYGAALSEAQTPPARILPLGDSLTEGVSGGTTVQGAYRNRLHTLLTSAGFNVDFVGTNVDSANPSLPDINHEGHGGLRIDHIQAGLSGWLNSVEDPDVVLLMIGTNDFSQNFNLGSVQSRLTNLIADIAVKRPFAKIIVATLPLRTDDPNKEAQQVAFNSAIPGIVSNQVSLGRQVSYADLHAALVSGDLADGIHPTAAGYNKLADSWLPAITSVITPLGTTNPPAIVRTGPPTDLQHLTVKFSKPLADSSANVANFSINGGLTVSQATLDAATKRIITLTTNTQTPGTLYTLAVSGVRDRTPAQTPIAVGSTIAFSTDAQTNGSFELDLAGWTSSGNLEIKSAAPYLPTDGTKLVAFNAGQSTPNGVLTQSFATTVGVPYVLAFDAGALGLTSQQRMQLAVTGSSSLVSQTITVSGPGGSGTTWAPQSFAFVANSTTTTMTFTDTSTTSNAVDLLLDNVRLTAQVPRTLTVASSPSNGINVTLSPADLNGASGAPTGFSRQYLNGTVVSLTAPASASGNTFVKWQRNGVDFTTSTNANLTLDADYTLNAVYAGSNQLLVNGGFESNFTGWTTTGNLEIRSSSPYVPTEGSRLTSFNGGNATPNGVLSQAFSTVAGVTYTVAFDAGVLSYNTSPQQLRVKVDGSSNVLNQVVTVTRTSGANAQWFPQSFTFVANSSSSTLSFTDQSSSTVGLDLTLDNVRVTGPAGPVNNSPVAVADAYTTNQNTALVVAATGVLGNDTDAESNPLTAVVDAQPAHGTVALLANGGFTYTPTTGYSGPDSFTYHANDGNSNSNIVTVSITVNPVASGALVNGSFEAGSPVSPGPVDGWTMSATFPTAGAPLGYVPDGGYPVTVPDGVRLLVFNGGGDDYSGFVSQQFATTPGATYTLSLKVGAFTGGVSGKLQRLQISLQGNAALLSQTEDIASASGVAQLLPKSYNFVADSALTTLTLTDGSGGLTPSAASGSDMLIDHVAVAPALPNQAPAALADSYSGPQNSPIVVAATGVLANDTDPDSNPLTAVLNVAPTHGGLTLNPNGSFTYTPDSGYSGPDSFTYHANDGTLDSNIATVSLTVTPVVAGALVNGSFEAGTPASPGPVDGWTMSGTYSTVGAPLGYVPDGGYPVTVPDGVRLLVLNGGSDIYSGFVSQEFATSPGTTYSLSLNVGLFSGGVSGKLQRLQISLQGNTPLLSQTEDIASAGGVAQLAPLSYTFVADSALTTLTLADASGGVTPSLANDADMLIDKVAVAVPAANNAPVAVADSYSGPQDSPVVVAAAGVLANDTDFESNPLTAVLNTAPSHGTVTLNPNGSFTYTPDSGYSGPDAFTYQANDGLLDSNIATVSITINGVTVSELLTNGGFETGTPANFGTAPGWTLSPTSTPATYVPDGGYAATPADGIRVLIFNPGGEAFDGSASQQFSTVPGSTYSLNLNVGVFSGGVAGKKQRLQITVQGNAPLLSQLEEITSTTGVAQLGLKSYTFVADSAVTTLTLSDASSGVTPASDAIFSDLLVDNVHVTGDSGSPNTPPVAVADSYSTNQDTALVIAASGVLANDTDAESTPLTAALDAGPTNGTVTLNPNGSFTYTPTSGYTGSDSFTYHANDGLADSNTVTVSLTVNAVITNPLVNGSFESNFTGWTRTGNMSVQSSAPYTATDGTKLASFNDGNLAPNGVLSQTFGTVIGQTYTVAYDLGVLSYNTSQQKMQVKVDGSSSLYNQTITVARASGANAQWFPQTFTFVANSGSATISFTDVSTTGSGLDLTLDNVCVTGPPAGNQAPVAVADSYSTNVNTALVVPAAGVLANDTDINSNPLTAILNAGPTNGTLTLNPNGSFTYTPNTGYTGPDSFTYHANDHALDSNVVTVSLAVSAPSSQLVVNGSFESNYTGWTTTGNQSIQSAAPYAATDGTKLASFNGSNLAPNAVLSQSFATVPGQTYTLAFDLGVLSYNSSQQLMKVTLTGAANLPATPSNASALPIVGTTNGNTWVPKSFTFVADSALTTLTFTDQSVATVGLDMLLDNVRVTGAPGVPNTAPVAVADSHTTQQDTALVIAAAGVLANDTDVDLNPLTAILNAGPAHGTVTLSPNGGFTYTPASGYSGPDSFTYHANDGIADSNIATVSINVTPFSAGGLANGSFESDEAGWSMTGNRGVFPTGGGYIAVDGAKFLAFNGAQTTPNAVVTQTFGTTPGQLYQLSFQIGTFAGNGVTQSLKVELNGSAPLIAPQTESVVGTSSSVSVWTARTISFTADSAATTLTFTDVSLVTDGVDLLLDDVKVTPVLPNEAPVATADSYTTTQNTALVIAASGVLANDTDVNSDPLTAALDSAPANGTLSLDPDGSFTYTPTTGFSGTDSFTYHATDSLLDSNIVTVSINVTASQVLVNGSFESDETGWNMTGHYLVYPTTAPYIADDGSKMVVLNAAEMSPDAVISQTFATVTGETYYLSFKLGMLAVNSAQQSLQVDVNSATPLTDVITLTGNGAGNTVWTSHTYSFVAAGPTTTLIFTDITAPGSASGADLLLDTVSVTGVSAGPPNTPPVAVADSYSASQDTPLVVAAAGVLANDTDTELNPLTAVLNAGPANGSVTLNPNGGFTYTPAAGYTGPDSFTYQANDGFAGSNVATVSITVSPSFAGLVNGSFESNFTGWTTTGNLGIQSTAPYTATEGAKLAGFNGSNQAPNGVLSQTFATVAGQTYTLAFDAGVLSYNTSPQQMRVKVDGTSTVLNQVVTVTRTSGANAQWFPQSFTFVANSATSTLSFTDQSTVTVGLDLTLDNVRVTTSAGGGNTAPVAAEDSYATPVSTALVISAAGVLTNDTDAQSNPLTAVLDTTVGHGTLALNANGSFTYTPTNGYSGPDSFTYHANDGSLNSSVVTVSITVGSPASTLVNGSFESGLSPWVASGGTVNSVKVNGTIGGTDGINIIEFNSGGSPVGGVLSQTFATVPGSTYNLQLDIGVLAYNTNQQRLQIAVAGNGSLLSEVATINGINNGTVKWEPRSYTFIANSTSTVLTFTDVSTTADAIDVLLDNVRVNFSAPPSAAPSAANDVYATALNTQLVVPAAGVLSNDVDAQSDPLTAALVAGPASGTLVLNPNGGFTYTPATGFTGTATFTYRASDGTNNSNVATVNINVVSAVATNLVNGSFESFYTGWTRTGSVAVETGANYPATDGTIVVSFNSEQLAPGGVLSQTLNTTPGLTYLVQFDAGVLAYNNAQQQMQFRVTGSGIVFSQTIVMNGQFANGTRWFPQIFTFVANSATSTLSFTDLSSTTEGIDMLLDNVRITPVLNTTPSTLTVTTTPATGISITAAPNDLNGNGSGSTQFTRSYTNGASVSLTAPATAGANNFVKWQKNGVDYSTSATTSVSMTSNLTMTAVYAAPIINLLANGSFETGTFAPWTVSGGTSESVEINGLIVGTNGTKIVEFNSSNSPSGGILTQTFATTLGASYTLAFDLGVLAYNTNPQTLKIDVTGSGSLLSQTATINGINNGTVKWEPKSYTFTANSSATTLTFTDTSASTNSLDMLLDNVRVSSSPALMVAMSAPLAISAREAAAPVAASSAVTASSSITTGAIAQLISPTIPQTTVGIEVIDGKKYNVITITKPAAPNATKPIVEVSPNLGDWFSGKKHTTVMLNNGKVLKVRDNTPIRPGKKRFIRIKPAAN
jgi:VCBS repeat-containing protein